MAKIVSILYRHLPSPLKRFVRFLWFWMWRTRNHCQRIWRLRPTMVKGLSTNRSLVPLVTVVVPVFDEQENLDDCLRSISSQSFKNFECVIIDDYSSDRSIEIAAQWTQSDSRFSLVRHEKNLGLAAARNTGLREAKGEYITFLDGDDFLFVDSLRNRAGTLGTLDDPRVIGVYCDWMPVPKDAKIWHPRRPPVAKNYVDFLSCGGEIPFIATVPLMRTKEFLHMGGFNEDLKTGEDFECWMRLLRHGYNFVYVAHVGVAYRQSSGGMVLSNPSDHAKAAVAVIEQLDQPLRFNETVKGTPFVYWEPRSSYVRRVRRIRRLIPPLTFAIASNIENQVIDILALFPDREECFVDENLNVEELINKSIGRLKQAGGLAAKSEEMNVRVQVEYFLREMSLIEK